MSQPLTDAVRNLILAAVPGATVHVASPDGEHFEALVISAAFEGLPLVKQQRLVMKALTGAFAERLHALQLKTFTPERWEQEKGMYQTG